MRYIIAFILILIVGIIVSAISKSSQDIPATDPKNSKLKPRKPLPSRRYPWFYVKNCVFYPNESLRFSYDEEEVVFLNQKCEESQRASDFEQAIKVCDEIIKVDWKSRKVWLDQINAVFSNVIKQGFEWSEEDSRKVVTDCYGFLQTFATPLDKSMGVKHVLVPILINRAKEMLKFQKESFSEEYTFEVYNMMINIYYLLPLKDILDFIYTYLLQDKMLERKEQTEKGIRSLIGHVEMLRNKYRMQNTREGNNELNIIDCILINDPTFITTIVGFYVNYPTGINKARIECRFFDEDKNEIFLGEQEKRYIEVFENCENKRAKQFFDIVVFGLDEIKSISLNFYGDDKKTENEPISFENVEPEGTKLKEKAEEPQNKSALDKPYESGKKETTETDKRIKKEENYATEEDKGIKKEEKYTTEADKGTNKEEREDAVTDRLLKKEENKIKAEVAGKGIYSADAEENQETEFEYGTNNEKSKDNKEKIMLLPSFEKIKEIAISEMHFLALKEDGTVIAIGNDNKLTNVENWTEVVSVFATNSASYGIKKDGTFLVNGRSNYENQGIQYTWDKIKKIVPSHTHIMALRENGTVLAVGDNSNGQCNVDGWYGIVDITASFHSVGLSKEGRVFATGENNFGECNTTMWDDIVEIAVGSFYTVGLKEDGTVFATGLNSCGQCNVSEWKGIKHIYARGNITVGLQYNGKAVITGNNSYRFDEIKKWDNIESIRIVNDRIIAIMKDGTVAYKGKTYRGKVNEDWKDIVSVTANSNNIVALKKDGTLICNDILFGILLKDNINRFIDIKEDSESGKLLILKENGEIELHNKTVYENYNYDCTRFKNIKGISINSSSIAGLKENGTVVMAGKDILLSVDVEAWNNLIKVEMGKGFAVGLKIDGRVLATGDNSFGQCDVASWTDIVDIKVSENRTIGIRGDGTVLSAGLNEFGELEFVKIFSNIIGVAISKNQIMLLDRNGNVKLSYHPEGIDRKVVEDWEDIKKIVAREEHFIALKNNGKVISTLENDEACKWENVIDIGASGIYTWGKAEESEEPNIETVKQDEVKTE